MTGIVLAGGQGSRMGGVDKGLVNFLGKPMVAHVIERLAPQVGTVLISANREIERYLALGLVVIQDEIDGYAGPLAGLHAGMQAANTPYVLSVPCDSPLLPTSLAARLMHALMEQHADIAVAKTGTQAHPVFCLCRTSLLAGLQDYLNAGQRKMDRWQKTLHVAEVSFDDAALAFSNVNTADELAALEQASAGKVGGTQTADTPSILVSTTQVPTV